MPPSYDNSISVPAPAHANRRQTDGKEVSEPKGIVKLILFFWFLRLFKPEWIAAYYFPSLAFLKPIPTLLLLVFMAYMILKSNKVQLDKPMLALPLSASLRPSDRLIPEYHGPSCDGASNTYLLFLCPNNH